MGIRLNFHQRKIYFIHLARAWSPIFTPVSKASVFSPDATGSKRFILNVEVTPEHKPRASSSLQPGPVLARLGPAAARAAAEEEIQREEAGVTAHAQQRAGVTAHAQQRAGGTAHAQQRAGPGDKRSIFSQLGQWLCHGGGAGAGEGLYATTGQSSVARYPI